MRASVVRVGGARRNGCRLRRGGRAGLGRLREQAPAAALRGPRGWRRHSARRGELALPHRRADHQLCRRGGHRRHDHGLRQLARGPLGGERLHSGRGRALPKPRTVRPRRSQGRIGELRLAIHPPLATMPDPEGWRPATARRSRPRRFQGEKT